MPMGILFWVIMLLWLLFGLYGARPAAGQQWNYGLLGGTLMEFILFMLLGWKTFGPPLQ